MLEKQRSANNTTYLIGAVIAALGFLMYAMGIKTVGIILLIIGIAIFMIAVSISNFFFKLDSKDMYNDKKQK